MASEAITEPETTTAATTTTAEDMEVENPQPGTNDASQKREREDEEENGVVSKRQKVEEEKSVEEARMEKLEENKENIEEVKKVDLGPKTFESSVQMFDYFYKLLHHWPTNVNVNKELIKKGHPEPEKKIGSGIRAFEIRQHPEWKSRCFFVIRDDDSFEDFSFRKCVDHILPLPENMKIKTDVNKALGGGGKKGGGGGGRGGGRNRGRGRGRNFR
ncbi:hypothetical protein RDABS01_018307, partial [Bienertia sinuspersici]